MASGRLYQILQTDSFFNPPTEQRSSEQVDADASLTTFHE